MVARHVQHAALLVHAHDAEVAVVGGVELGLLGLVGGFLEVFGELLLDLEEGGLLVDEVLEEGGVEESSWNSSMARSSSSSSSSFDSSRSLSL